MCIYRERMRAPLSWWLLGLTAVIILGAEVIAGFGWLAAVVVYGTLGGGLAALLVSWGRAGVEVRPTELRAGTARLPLSSVGKVAELTEAQTRAIRGPRGDPAALLLTRPYLKRAVYIEVTGGRQTPYWLLGSRHPAELAAAITAALPAANGSRVG
ncbi:MAG TPA: DUF3093 domain-containing protein [Streptosporangiaceae bacterium]